MRTFLLRLHNRKPIRLPTSVPDQHCGKEKPVYIAGADCRVNMAPETSPEPPVSIYTRSTKPLVSTYKHGVTTQNCTHCRGNTKPLVLHISLSKGKDIFRLKQKHHSLPTYPFITEINPENHSYK